MQNQTDKKKENPLRLEKMRKQESLLEKGIELYPHTWKKNPWKKNLSCSESLKKKAEAVPEGELSKDSFYFAGRLMRKRAMGKAAFFTLQDEKGQFQCYIRKDSFASVQTTVSQKPSSEESKSSPQTEENQTSPLDRLKTSSKGSLSADFNDSWGLWKLSDIGDIFAVRGQLFKTKKGEPSLKVQDLKMLCKSVEPLPEKYHGLEDVELKYRFRHLDLLMNPESKKIFKTRSQIISEIRAFMNRAGFMEVETPVLQPVYGGAAAEPFETHFRRLGNQKMYLKISPEIYLKKLIVGGFEKIYEIGKNFRNEGIDRTHNPEFTMMEYYQAYTDYKDQMRFFKKLVNHVVKKIRGSLKFEYQGRELNFEKWETLTLKKAIQKYSCKEAGLYESWLKSQSHFDTKDSMSEPSLKNQMGLDKIGEKEYQQTISIDSKGKDEKESQQTTPIDSKKKDQKESQQNIEDKNQKQEDQNNSKPFELNPDKVSFDALLKLLKQHYPEADYSAFELRGNISFKETEQALKEELTVMAFELIVEKHLWNPAFIIDFPLAVSPLTKSHRKQKRLVERFEPYIAGMELGNAYTELNDPIEQRKRLERQQRWSKKESSQEAFNRVSSVSLKGNQLESNQDLSEKRSFEDRADLNKSSQLESNQDLSEKRNFEDRADLNKSSQLESNPSLQEELKKQDTQKMDENFLHALEVGMPPTGGAGLGIERLIMILTDQKSVRDCILFPAQKNIKGK